MNYESKLNELQERIEECEENIEKLTAIIQAVTEGSTSTNANKINAFKKDIENLMQLCVHNDNDDEDEDEGEDELSFELLSVDAKPRIDVDSDTIEFSWKITVQNITDKVLHLDGSLFLLDEEGFEVDSDYIRDFVLKPQEQGSCTGRCTIYDCSEKAEVASISAKLSAQ